MKGSRTAVIVLAMAAEAPAGPYEMIKVLERVNIRRWYPISDASVYLAVKNLEKKGLLEGTRVREGSMPEKTVYTITARGREALESTLEAYLDTQDAREESFDIAMLFICHIPRERAIEVLEKKAVRLGTEIERAERQLRELAGDPRVPFTGPLMVRHRLLLKQADLATTRELADAARRAERWDFFAARDLG